MSATTDTMPTAQREATDRVIAAILDPTGPPPVPAEDYTEAPDQMTDRQADREYAVDADYAAACSLNH